MNEGKMANKMKRFLSLALALLMVLSMVPQISIGAKAADTMTIYFQNNWQWSDVKIYYWGSSGTNPSWSGYSMTFYENDGTYDVYKYDVPTDVTGIIFNGTGEYGFEQSIDITSGWSDGLCYSMIYDGQKNVQTSDKYVVADWTPSTETKTIYYTGSWTNAYYWSSEHSDYSMVTWPGTAMTEAADGVYAIDVSVDADKIIFNNGSDQTADLSIPTDGKNYYNNGTWSTYTLTVVTTTYYVAGTDGLCGGSWDVAGDAMTLNQETGLYEITFEDVIAKDEPYEFKVTQGDWNLESWGDNGANYKVSVTETSDVTITFNADTKEIKVVTTPVSGGNTEDDDTITVYFRNDWLWPEVYVHYWNDSQGTTWPGVKMTATGETYTTNDGERDIYSAEIPADVTGIIFNGPNNEDNSITQQTTNIESGIKDGNAYYIYYDGAVSNNNVHPYGTFTYTPSDDGGDGGDTGKVTYKATFHFANTLGWSKVNLYVWNNDGATTGSWPGTEITQLDEDRYHTMTVSWEAESNNGLNYIFNNGGSQTIDLALDASYFDNEDHAAEVWVMLDSAANAEGKYVTKQVSTEKLDIALAVSPQVNGTSVTFEYVGDNNTTSVAVRGDFNDWGETPMTKNEKGIWTVTVENLSYGIHEYKFYVNGSDWISDPANSWSQNDNSAFLILDPNAKDENKITVKIHFTKADGDYTGWNLWVWSSTMDGHQVDFADVEGEKVAAIVLEDARAHQDISFIPRYSTDANKWAAQEATFSIDLSDVVSGTVDYYVTYGSSNGVEAWNADLVKGNKIVSAMLDYDTGNIVITTTVAVDDPENAFGISAAEGADEITVTGVEDSGTTYTLTLSDDLELATLYQYKILFDDHTYEIKISDVYASDKFAEEYTYTGSDLGATWTSTGTTFKVWAPTATEVSVNLYQSGTEGTDDLIETVAMTKGEKGVWTVTVNGDLNGTYYTYAVTVDGEEVEAVDPYARATGVNGNRGMVVDLDSTDPEGWASDSNPNSLTSYTDAVIYELHVRDFSIDESSGVSAANRGKYLAFTETGTTVNSAGDISSGIDYLDELGVTHVHLLPVYDYASVDETTGSTYNWGYDPQNYNVPEGSYSTNPYDGAVRVQEFKQMVQSLHDHDISVIMDVVYNHVYNADTFCFNNIVPGYFSRVDSNTSGCGNDTASEREMVRKYIVESVCYWADEYHIDGFRFDLVGLLDVETINQIVTEVHKTHPNVIFYGEGWDMDSTNKEEGTEMAKQGNASKTPGFAYFSDSMRNGIGGNNGNSTGFASGAGNGVSMVSEWMANPWWTSNPTQVVQYASCHDNYTLADKIIKSTGKSGIDETVIKMNNLAAAFYMTAQGIPFIHAGEEMLREKLNTDGSRNENSYNSSDSVNSIKWSNLDDATYVANSAYYKGLIAFRKAHPALSMDTAAEVKANVYNQQASDNLVSFWIDGREIAGEEYDSIYVIFNANSTSETVTLPVGDWDICINGTQAGTETIETVSGSVSVDGISAMVLVQKESTEEPKNTTSDWALPGSFNNWNTASYMTYGDSDNIVTTTLSLPAGTYEFKVKNGDAWYGNSGTIIDTTDTTSASGWDMSASEGSNCKLEASGGAYTFTYDTTTNKLIVTYDPNGGDLGDPDEYYLCGYINGVDYAEGLETGDYKFENGTLTTTFTSDSYVYVKNGDSSAKYMTDGYQGTVTSATLKDTNKCTLTKDKWDKMLVPGGVEVTFTLVVNDDNTVTLSYEATSSGVQDTSGIQNGVTLHCWNWSFAEIEANMATIAAQGYTAIQTSPVQAMKEDTVDSTVGTHWWVYYQPVDFKINDEDGNALGTKSELESMIATAHEYGVKVIVDVVANHLGNKTGNDLADKIPEYLRKNEYWHDIDTDITDWDDRYNMTQYCLSGLPDLNTSNKEVQNYVLAFLKECIDIGVDGFRFDMAKSIETPKDDASFASDFWPTVVGGAEDYAEEKGKDIYVYGEVLDDAKITISAYTEYMSVTDNGWGNHLRTNIVSGTAALVSGFYKSADASNLVIWAESHDTYADGSSSDVSEENINKTWALVAARADAMGLYLARPESTEQLLGVASKTAWANAEVKAVNEFHNAFAGQDETVSNEGSISYVERGTSGVVLVNVNGTTVSVSVTANAMADGTYTDQITGNTFTVANGQISGEIGSTGIAVVYNPAVVEKEYTVTVEAGNGGTVTVDNETPKAGVTVTVTVTPDSGKEADQFTVTDADGKEVASTKLAEGKYTFEQPAGNVTVKVTFKDAAAEPATKYNVTVKETTGGKVVVSNLVPEAGVTVTITAKPNSGKLVDKVTVTGKDGKAVTVTDKGNGTYTYVQPASDVTVEVTFKAETTATVTKHNVTVKDTTGGKVEVSNQTPETGATVTITAKPDSGKMVDKITVTDKDGKAVTVKDNGDGTYTYEQPDSDVTIQVTFKNKQTSTSTGNTTTGDNSQLGLWIGLMVISLLMVMLLLIIKRKRTVENR